MKNEFYLTLVFTMVASLNSVCQDYNRANLILVKGKKVAYQAFGLETRKPGTPVIVFESGGGGGSFHQLFPLLFSSTSGIAYDRNGMGKSEPDSSIQSDEHVVRRLHDFLQSLKVEPPYLLVGHSVGGAFIRLFTSVYPQEVAGLVFIDATDFMLTKEEDSRVKKVSKSTTGYRELYYTMLDKLSKDSLVPPGIRNESLRVRNANAVKYFAEYQALGPIPNVPTAVLIAYHRNREKSEAALYKELKINEEPWWKELNNIRIQHFADLIKNNRDSRIILLPRYSHGIHHQDPNLVANVIIDIYKRSMNRD